MKFGLKNARRIHPALGVASLGLGLAGLIGASSIARAQDVGKDVPEGHWAHQAIEDLASKGLIQGYPADGRFLGARTLTRYEMATIIDRVVKHVEDVAAKAGNGANADDVKKLQANMDEIRQLVNDFKAQLAVIGTDLDKAKTAMATIDDLTTKVNDLSTKVDGYDTKISDLSKKVDDNSVITDQALENIKQIKEALPGQLAKKVDVGTGKLKIGGTLQMWYGTAFGDTFGGAFPANTSNNPGGRNYGISGAANDSFRIRRGEINFTGSIIPKVDFKAMFDMAKTGTNNASVLQDLWIGYQLTPSIRFEVGQQKTGLSEEGPRNSGQLLTIERSLMNSVPVTAGRVGDIRDTGAMLRYAKGPVSAFAGIWDDNGLTQSITDINRDKFADGGIFYKGLFRHITLGVWGGTSVTNATTHPARERAGATFIWQSGPHFLEAEGAYSVDRDSGALGANGPSTGPSLVAGGPVVGLGNTNYAIGGYVLYAHTISPMWQLVGRYDMWTPSIHGVGTGVPGLPNSLSTAGNSLYEYTVGVNYYLKGHNAKIQLNGILDQSQNGGGVFWGKGRSMVITNFQIAF